MTSHASAPTPTLDDRDRADIARALASASGAWSAGDRPRAVRLLDELARRFPGVAAIRAQLGAFALEAGDWRAARTLTRSAAADAPGDSAIWSNLGTACLHLARTDDSIAAYRRALELDARSLGAHVGLANALQQGGDIDAAVGVLEAALNAIDDSAE